MQLIKQLANWVTSFIYLLIVSERLKKLIENYVVSNHKLIEALGTQLPVTSKDGLLHTARNFSINSR
jgi:hypothetical protein